MFHNVVQVIPMEDYKVYVYFEDGKIVCFDAKHLLDKPIFSKLNDIHFFMEGCIILNDTLAWDMKDNRDPYDCVDIDPDMLYELEHVSEKIA